MALHERKEKALVLSEIPMGQSPGDPAQIDFNRRIPGQNPRFLKVQGRMQSFARVDLEVLNFTHMFLPL